MKKLLAMTIVFLFAMISISFAEPYKSSKFPPEEIIKKSYTNNYSKGSFFLHQIIGKYKDADGKYYLYTYTQQGDSIHFSSDPIILIKLDTDMWIIKFRNRDAVILEN